MKSQVRLLGPIGDDVEQQHAEQRDRHPDAEQQAEDEAAVLGAASARTSRWARRHAHSYTCRYLRTNRMEIRFMISVITNRVMPTAKMVL